MRGRVTGQTVVGFDSATDDTVVCALRGDETLYESREPPPEHGGRPLHGTALLAEIEAAADAAGGWGAVDIVAVGSGPGSFTGLRIGIATAKGLGAGLAVELRAVSTLSALAHGAAGVTAPGQSCMALIDGRRGEVFAALEGPGSTWEWGPLVCGPEDLIERCEELPAPPLAVGSGALRFLRELSASGIEVPPADHPVHRVAARDVCVIAAAGGGSAEIAPLYLRKPDAERWRERADLKGAGG